MSAVLVATPRRLDDAARVRMAERADTPAEMLFFLANDPASTVRAAIAANAATPPLADRLLARDSEPGVRRVLARKLAALAPSIDPLTADRHRRATWEALMLLSEDEAVAVRVAITELVAELAQAPRPLILRLARDVAMAVAEPVLRGSPLLEEEDLLRLIADPPAAETLGAIARRPHLPEGPSAAIAARWEEASVAALLANATARIGEETLLAIVARSGDRARWQAAFVRRPSLGDAVIRELRGIVAGEALRILLDRTDPGAAGGHPPVREEDADGPVSEEGFIAAARQGRKEECARVLAALSGLPAGVVARALAAREPATLVALCWKAGMSGRAATFAQLRLTEGRPEDLLVMPGGGWVLSEAVMRGLVEGLLRPH